MTGQVLELVGDLGHPMNRRRAMRAQPAGRRAPRRRGLGHVQCVASGCRRSRRLEGVLARSKAARPPGPRPVLAVRPRPGIEERGPQGQPAAPCSTDDGVVVGGYPRSPRPRSPAGSSGPHVDLAECRPPGGRNRLQASPQKALAAGPVAVAGCRRRRIGTPDPVELDDMLTSAVLRRGHLQEVAIVPSRSLSPSGRPEGQRAARAATGTEEAARTNPGRIQQSSHAHLISMRALPARP